MKHRMLVLGLFTSAVLTSTLLAQGPAVPAIPGAVPATPAAPGNLWSFLLPNKEQCAKVKTCFCESGIGQMVNGLAGPMSLMTGGMLKNRCMQNSILNDLKKPADSPAGAAARVKADEAEAKERREAVRVLGNVDCNYWPEAIATLKVSLRKDRNECVRFEAALALRNGCCCNKEIIKALEICVTGSNVDGFPSEKSDRVRAAAAEALARCPIIAPDDDKKKVDQVRNTFLPNVDPAEFYKKVSQMSNEQVIASARAALTSVQQAGKTQPDAATIAAVGYVPPIQQRNSSLVGIVSNAFGSGGDSQPRTPFFSGLTKSLTGKLENTVQQFVPQGSNAPARLPDIRSTTPTEITPPAAGDESSQTPRMQKIEGGIDFSPTIEPVNPPVDKKPMAMPGQPSTSRANDPKTGADYIQLSPHVRQIQQPGSQSAPLFEATPVTIAPPIPVPVSILPTTGSPVMVNLPSTTSAPLGQVREARPPMPPEILQTQHTLPRESRGTVTIEIGER